MQHKSKLTLVFKTHLELNEDEVRALEALAGYGADNFLKVFYEHLGKHYMEPHEKGLRSLFEAIRTQLSPEIHEMDNVRKAIGKSLLALQKKQ